jgi:hypothetical protein
MNDGDRILHSKEQWAQIEAEAMRVAGKKGAAANLSKLILPEQEEIRSARPIPKAEIQEVVVRHQRLHNPMRLLLTEAYFIGHKLRGWHDLIAHGKWLKWCAANIPEIHERTIQRYLKLAENQKWLESEFQKRREMGLVSDLKDLPGIKDSLLMIEDRERKQKFQKTKPASPIKPAKPAKPIEIEAKVTSASNPVSDHSPAPQPS